MPEDKIVSHAKVVIIGGGIMGVSLLYHLAKDCLLYTSDAADE